IAMQGVGGLSGDIASGQTLSLESTCSGSGSAKAAATFTSAGTIVFAQAGSCAGFPSLTIPSGATLTNDGAIQASTEGSVQGLGVDAGTATSSAGFTNAGTIVLTNTQRTINLQSTLAISSGTLTNTGAIDFEPGTGGPRRLSGNLTNSGSLAVDTSTTYDSGLPTSQGGAAVGDGKTPLVATGRCFPDAAAGLFAAA